MNKTSLSAALLALACHAASAVVIPVSEDTYVSPSGVIAKGFGKGNFMQLSGDGAAALVRFDVADYAGLIQPANVSSARLVFHLSNVKKAGNLTVRAVTSEWTEAAQGNRPGPALNAAALYTIPANAVIEDQYAIVDVTAQVKQWLTTPASDFGLAVTCGPATNVQIATKEGVTTGHPAWLEIESHPVTGNDQIAAGVDAAKLGDGTVSNAEFAFLNGVLSPIQTQINTVTSNADGKVSKAGDTMTGPLVVNSDIKLGSEGQHQAAAADEKLRFLRGNVTWQMVGTSTITNISQVGQGYTVTNTSGNDFTVTFTTPFPEAPTVTSNYFIEPNSMASHAIKNLSATGFTFSALNQQSTHHVRFIVAGPR